MHYRINEVASMLGISPQTLRFYEQYGIMLHERVGDGNYRQYGDDSIDALMTLRKYRNCGFTVAQTAKIVMEQNMTKTAEALESQADKLLWQAEMNKLIAAKMQENVKQLRWLRKKTMEFELCKNQQMYIIPVKTRADENISANMMKQIGDIVAWLPLLKWATCFIEGQESVSNGFVVQEEDAVFLGIDQWASSIKLPETVYLKCVTQWSTETLPDKIAEVQRTIGDTEENLSGRIMAMTTGNYHDGEKTFSYGEIWIEKKPTSVF
ncbi:MAG: MerR family transcriptional regulator [Clostridia bacterium]|nr:MerR family transcriptional regulator [Clostridia bacterium]